MVGRVIVIMVMMLTVVGLGQAKPETIYYPFNSDVSHTSVNQVLTVMRSLGPEDKMVIYINSLGGSVAAAEDFIEELKKRNNQITIIVHDYAASAAAMMAINAKNLQMRSDAVLMFHMPRLVDKKTKKIVAKCTLNSENTNCTYALQFVSDNMERLKKFLTKEQLDEMFIGLDVYVSGKEAKRLNKDLVVLKSSGASLIED